MPTQQYCFQSLLCNVQHGRKLHARGVAPPGDALCSYASWSMILCVWIYDPMRLGLCSYASGHTLLRGCYAVSGTRIAYAPPRQQCHVRYFCDVRYLHSVPVLRKTTGRPGC
eukprot:314388-Rhodomonas_salina.5